MNLLRANVWLFSIFVMYLMTAVVFALVYFELNAARSSCFTFNPDVLKTQKVAFRNSLQFKVDDLSLQLKLVKRFGMELEHWSKAPTFEGFFESPKTVFSGPDYDFIFTFYVFVAGPVASVGPSRLVIRDKTHLILADIDLLWIGIHQGNIPRDLSDSKRVVGKLIGYLSAQSTEAERQLKSLGSSSPEAPEVEVWSIWDFLYFSIMTQTTVGYGDILPNSTTVRLIVAVQSLIGILLLAVIINLVKPARAKS
jgi:hypothetical protein